jgi:hypothetical protein
MNGQLSPDRPDRRPADNRTDNTPPLGGVCPVSGPRLLTLKASAEHLGLSFWTVRDYVLQGLIPTVDLPPLRAREGERQRSNLRRVLIDRQDLDRFIESRKVASGSPGASGQAPRAPESLARDGETQGIAYPAHERMDPMNTGDSRGVCPGCASDSGSRRKGGRPCRTR